MKKIFFFITYIIICQAKAQITFQKTFTWTGNGITTTIGCTALQTPDSGYIVVSNASDFGTSNYYVYVIKTDYTGDTIWTRTIAAASFNLGLDVRLTNDGGYVISGRTLTGTFEGDILLIKIDATGNVMWTKLYGGAGQDFGWAVEPTNDGGYIVTGVNYNNSSNGSIVLIKTDALGDTLWTKTYGGVGEEVAFSVKQTYDGGYVVYGYTTSITPAWNNFIMKTDSYGNILWNKTIMHNATSNPCYLNLTSDGGFIVTGCRYDTTNYQSIYLIKTDSVGNLDWYKTYNTPGIDKAGYVRQTLDGGYIVAGEYGTHGLIIKTDSTGGILWSKTNVDLDVAESVEETIDGGYIVCGPLYGGSATGNDCIYLMKTDSAGNGCGQTNIALNEILTPINIVTSQIFETSFVMNVNTPLINSGSGSLVNTVCTTVGLAEKRPGKVYEVYPNPSNGIIKIKGNFNSGTQLIIYNSMGVKIFDRAFKNNSEEFEKDMSGFTRGIYFLRITDNQSSFTCKMILTK